MWKIWGRSNIVSFGRIGKINKITIHKLFKMQNCFSLNNTLIDFADNWCYSVNSDKILGGKIYMKKIIAIALALVMCLGIMSMVAFAAGSGMTVKVVAPAEWEECYVYSWNPAKFGDWPGTKVTNGSFELSEAVEGMVISAGNEKPQTTDIKDLVFTAGGEATITVGEAVDGKHTYTIAYGGSNNGGSTTQPTTTQPTTTQPTTTQPTTTGNRNLTVKVPSSWTKVYIYTWEPEEYGTFPGGTINKSGDVYTASIKNSMVNLIVTGEKADTSLQQTPNITLTANGKNVTITVAEDGQPTVTYAGETAKPSTGKDAAPDPTTPLSTYRVVGNTEWLGNWDAASDKGRMHDMGNGVYRVNFDNVAPGSYQIKITKDGKWDNAYGTEDGQNYSFTVSEKCKITVDFTIKDGKGVIEVYGKGVSFGDVSMLSVVILMALASVTAVVLVVNKKKFI